jgi:ATPase subunit of ABC transporter with duplicated ATPase domains
VAEPKDEGFKVVDRRLFTEQGELRKDIVEQERRDEEAASKKAAEKSKTAAAKASDAAAKAAGGQASDAEPAEEAETIPPSRSFQMLIDFLTRNAAAMLGGMADPRTGQPFVDIEGAREMIDMLDVLREKTKGQLAKADSDLLIEVLGSLKLTFMEISKAAAEAMTKKGMKTGG